MDGSDMGLAMMTSQKSACEGESKFERRSQESSSPETESDDEERDTDTDTDTESEYESIQSYPNHEFERDLARLYQEQDFHQILVLGRFRSISSTITSASHLIISLALFNLGRVGGALRELAFAIELEADPIKRESLLVNLADFFKDLGMPQSAVETFAETLEMAQIDSRNSKANELNESYLDAQQRIQDYQQEIENLNVKCIKSSSIAELENLSIHEQTNKYLSSGGNITGFSIGKLTISNKALVDSALMKLKNYDQDTKFDNDPVQEIFDSITSFGPLYIYDDLIKHKTLVIKFLDDELNKHPEISYSMSPKHLGKMLNKWRNRSTSKSLISICGIILKHKIILGFINYLEGSFEIAIDKFKWILNLFSILENKYYYFINKNHYLANVTKRVTLLLLIKSYMNGEFELKQKDWAKLLTRLIAYDNITSTIEHLTGRLTQLFSCCALIYEKLATQGSVQFTIPFDSSLSSNDISRFQPIGSVQKYDNDQMAEMVRKLILAVASMGSDDSTDVYYYDRIIWGILMCGGIHLRTVWFFILIRNFFAIDHDYGPIHICKTHKHQFFPKSDILGEYVNGWELVDGLYRIVSEFTSEELDSMWDSELGNTFLLPQMFEAKNPKRIIMLDEYYSEIQEYSITKFSQTSKLQIRLNPKSHLKLPRKQTQERIDLSRDLINLWSDAYKAHQGTLPDFIKLVKFDA